MAYRGKQDVHFSVGDMVFLRITGDQFQPPKGTASKLTRKYEGSFRVKKIVGEVAYELELPHHMHMKHPIFHMSQLKRCRLDADHPERVELPRGPAKIMDKADLELEKILSFRTTGIGYHMKWEFLVRWKNALEDSLWRWKKKIEKYDRKLLRRS